MSVKNKKLLIVTYGTFIHEILKINKNLLKNISLAVFHLKPLNLTHVTT